MPIKVVLTDDHIMILDGLKAALAADPEIEIVGSYLSGKELYTNIRKDKPDVLLLDLQLPDQSGQEIAMQTIKEFPDIKIVILSGIESPQVIQAMMKIGCKSYLLKTTTHKNAIIQAIKAVYNGQIYLEPDIKERLLVDVLEAKPQRLFNNKSLTAREKEILQLLAEEYTNQQIADSLFISLRTVENHRHSLIQKLEVKNAIGLIKVAIELKLID